MALRLDAADLVTRVQAVERSLAHAEKLTAVGEAAARIAHDVRNPITAARSLAQQLVTEADDPFREEHTMMLSELERVEHHVAALLRFSRRDEPNLVRVDVAEVVRRALAPLLSRLAADTVTVTLEAPDRLAIVADAEALHNVK